jgi:ribosomal protein S18 acetylase RimI-like enzyme
MAAPATGDVTFVPLADGEVGAFIARSRKGFVEGQVAAGEERAAVEARADAVNARVLRHGKPDPDHRMGNLVVDGEIVGQLWAARDLDNTWYVWDVLVEPGFRRLGYGRAAMVMAGEMAEADGATAIGLSVQASNRTALSLYRSLGYDVQDSDGSPLIRMRKPL